MEGLGHHLEEHEISRGSLDVGDRHGGWERGGGRVAGEEQLLVGLGIRSWVKRELTARGVIT